MKEAEGGLSAQSAGDQPPADPGNKADKDMKGLVYQGGAPPPEPPPLDKFYSDEPKPSEEEPKKEEGYVGLSSTQGQKDDTILTMTENSGGKLRIILLVIIAAIIIIGVVYLALHAKAGKTITTTSTIKGAPITTTVGFNRNKTVIYNIDLAYNYTGPVKVNNTKCGQNQISVVKTYTARYNASTTFYLYDTESSGYCPLSINKITATTKGFTITQINPPLPSKIPAYSSVYLIMKVQTPAFNYTGPLSIQINEN